VVTGLAYAWFVFFAFYSIRYEYFPGFFLVAIGLAACPLAESAKGTSSFCPGDYRATAHTARVP
jgi:hypothetical protein